MRLYRTTVGTLLEIDGKLARLNGLGWDDLFTIDEDLPGWLHDRHTSGNVLSTSDLTDILAPITTQEVWAAGVTYLRSRTARMEESKSAGGGDFYDRVYHAA